MKKYIKFAGYGLGGLALLLVLVVAIFAATFNPNDYKQKIIDIVKEKKQRTLVIDGDISLSFWPKLGANLGKVSLSEHEGDKIFASMNSAKVAVGLLPLLSKQLVIDTIYLDGATANIVRYKDGTTNFDDLISKEEEESQEIKFDIDGIIITNSGLSFNDQQADATYQISKLNLKTGHVALAEPFDLETDFAVTASKPLVNAVVKINGNIMADTKAKHYVLKGLDANITGDLPDFSGADIKISGDVDAKPETLEFLVDSLKLAATGNYQGAKVALDVAAPNLVVNKDQVKGKEATISLSQVKTGQELTAKVVVDDISGTPASFESGGVKAEINSKNGDDTFAGKFSLADVKGSKTSIQSSGIVGDFTGKQGGRDIAGKFSSPVVANLEKMIFELPKLAGDVDIKDKTLPNGGIKGTFALKLLADVKAQKVNSDFNLSIDGTKLNGNVAVASFSQPNIGFNLNADQLDLNKLLGKPKAETKAAQNKANGSKPAHLSALKNLRINGKLNVGTIIYDKYRIQNLNTNVLADGTKLELKPLNVKFDDSQIKGSVGIANFAKPLYRFDLDIDQIDADRYVSKAPATSTAPKSDQPLDLSALKALNAEGSLRIGSLKFGNVKSSGIRVDLKADGEKLKLDPLAAKIDDSQVNAKFSISRFSDPIYAFNLNIDKLDADRYITKSSSTTKSTGDAPIDLSALKKLNASGDANIGWLKLANVKTSNVKVGIKAAGGVATVAPFSANLYQGSMSSNLVVDARATPTISFKTDMKGIEIGPLMTDAVNNDILNGKGNLDVDVKTSGSTVGALKRALGGNADVKLADGSIKGIDIAGTLRGYKEKLSFGKKDANSLANDKTKKTDFSELTATFDIKNGVAHNEDLAMKAPILRLAKGDSKGDFDIGAEKINYLAKPTLVASLKGQGGSDLDSLSGVAIPIRLKGTFSQPDWGVDFGGFAQALAKNKLLEGVGGTKGEAVKGLLGGGDKADALKGLFGKKKPAEAPQSTGATATPAPAAEEPKSAKEQAKEQALKKLFNF